MPPTSLFLGASGSTDEGAAAWASFKQGTLPIAYNHQHPRKLKEWTSTTSTQYRLDKPDFCRSLGIGVLILFLVFFQGPFPSGLYVGRPGGTVILSSSEASQILHYSLALRPHGSTLIKMSRIPSFVLRSGPRVKSLFSFVGCAWTRFKWWQRAAGALGARYHHDKGRG